MLAFYKKIALIRRFKLKLTKMKKLFTVIVAALVGFSAFAQNWYIGGEIGFAKAKDVDAGFTFSPDFGYSFSDNLCVGAVLSYANKTSYLTGTNTFAIGGKSWEVAPYLRYIPFKWGQVGFYVDNCLCFYGGKEAITNDKYTGFSLDFAPGITIDLTDHISVDFCLGLLEYAFSEPQFTFNAGTNSSIGFFYSF